MEVEENQARMRIQVDGTWLDEEGSGSYDLDKTGFTSIMCVLRMVVPFEVQYYI